MVKSGTSGPEALRTLMAQLRPEDIGLSGAAEEAALNHFQVSVLTEGSGTQIFSTTFVPMDGARGAPARPTRDAPGALCRSPEGAFHE